MMFIIGDFVPEKIVEEVKKRLVTIENRAEIKRILEEEPEKINKEKIEEKMEVNIPMFIIGIKSNSECEEDLVKKHIAIEIILNMLAGKSSEIYKKLYETGSLNEELSLEYEYSKTYGYIMISGQSKNPEEILKLIKEKIREYKEKGIDEETFKRIGKMIYGEYIKQYNNISEIANMFLSDYMKGVNSFDYLEEFKQVTKEYAEQILKEIFNEENIAISIVK